MPIITAKETSWTSVTFKLWLRPINVLEYASPPFQPCFFPNRNARLVNIMHNCHYYSSMLLQSCESVIMALAKLPDASCCAIKASALLTSVYHSKGLDGLNHRTTSRSFRCTVVVSRSHTRLPRNVVRALSCCHYQRSCFLRSTSDISHQFIQTNGPVMLVGAGSWKQVGNSGWAATGESSSLQIAVRSLVDFLSC